MDQEEFLPDLINFLETRGHGRLIPPAGVDAFPEVVLNGKRLDLYNLYKEVNSSKVYAFVSILVSTYCILKFFCAFKPENPVILLCNI